ncbi:MAG TPA: protein-glutamate O-methyltransferase CheR [Sphingomonas sp.]|jgi:chemotaxis protein methyltransferase CheR|uniref:CheR family methyltransferase n=1 Tax=Sphingomonas sp. TaxID=28214 RepID=UPI002EDAA347
MNVAGLGTSDEGFVFTRQDFDVIARMVHAHSGIFLSEAKTQLVYSRLAKFLREHRMTRFSDYVEMLRTDAEERKRAVYALTTNHTRFFREDHHFDHMTATLRPLLLKRIAAGNPVRLWSSASSSGEEPYSMAMTLLGTDRAEANRIIGGDVAILATDLAPHVIAAAKAGRYPIAQGPDIPDRYARLWMKTAGDTVVMGPEIQKLVAFRQLNLLDEWPIKGKFDAIFCRNVMIYFDEPTKARLIERFHEKLVPNGFLYIGHSERLVGPATDRFEPAGQTIFRRRG